MSFTRRSVWGVALLVCFLGWLSLTRYPPLQEYRLYLTEPRVAASLPWRELNTSWNESNVRQRFAGLPVRCYADGSGMPGATRTCAVDLRSLNGVPAMYANFFFSQKGLLRVAIAIPWWSHSAGFASLHQEFGEPAATQTHSFAGVRLHGWKLADGAGVFCSADRPINPLEPSSIQWVSAEACGAAPCIR